MHDTASVCVGASSSRFFCGGGDRIWNGSWSLHIVTRIYASELKIDNLAEIYWKSGRFWMFYIMRL